MKKSGGFWLSFETYVQQVVKRNPLPYPWIGITVMVVVLMASIFNVKNSLAGAQNSREVIERAAEQGDYALAQALFEQIQDSGIKNQVLGVDAELEDMVYPERRVERRIAELEQKLVEYPGNREMYLTLADLYGQLDNQEMSSEYREMARVLDPNDAYSQ